MRKVRRALIAAGMAACAAFGGPVKAGPDLDAGEAVYRDKCMICHGADGQGKTGFAKAMKLQPAQLGSDQVQKKTDAELKKIILEGSNNTMKPIKGLSDADIANVIAYVRTTFKKK